MEGLMGLQASINGIHNFSGTVLSEESAKGVVESSKKGVTVLALDGNPVISYWHER
jgi:hypothetical protein